MVILSTNNMILLLIFQSVILSLVSGVPFAEEEGRIVGGANAGPEQFPHQASLRQGGSHICGCSIIASKWLLTAAHCVTDTIKDKTVVTPVIILQVVVGTTKLNEGRPENTYFPDCIIVHPEYNSKLIANDVAIIRVTVTIQTSTFVKQIDLIPLNYPSSENIIDVVLSGWGLTSYPGSIPNDLQFIKLKKIPLEDCKHAHNNKQEMVTDGNVCTFTQIGQGACMGDSGGPLVYYYTSDRSNVLQIGIVSWGTACAKGQPDVFASVAHFNAWINKNMNENQCVPQPQMPL